jgi:hypothetical protein
MFTTLRSWFAPKTRTISRKSAPKARLRLERLEDRVTPGNYSVTVGGNATGLGSLNMAITMMDMDNDPNNTITFAATLNGPINMSGINLSHNVVIDGNGSTAPITGNGTASEFHIGASSTVVLKNLQITGGGGTGGGGILNDGT